MNFITVSQQHTALAITGLTYQKESPLLKLYLNPDGTTDVQLLPAMNDNTYTYMIINEDERKAYYKFMEDISFDVEFDENGFIFEKQ